LTSLLKSLKGIRYDKPEIFNLLTTLVIEKIAHNLHDETLIFFYLNRLAFMNEVECFMKIYHAMKQNKAFNIIESK